jgi:hypothetical protein
MPAAERHSLTTLKKTSFEKMFFIFSQDSQSFFKPPQDGDTSMNFETLPWKKKFNELPSLMCLLHITFESLS